MARSLIKRLPTWTKDGAVNAVVESPKGSAVKFDYDPKLGVFLYGKALPLGLTYPYCWGFLPGTEGDDGDPLDVFIIHDSPTYPGVVVECRLIGVLQLEQDGKKGRERNDRLMAVPVDDPRIADGARDIVDMPQRMREEIEQFFLSTTFFTQKNAKCRGWKGRKTAEKLVRRSEI